MKTRTKEQIAKEVFALIESEVEARLAARVGVIEPMRAEIQNLSYDNDRLTRELRIAKQELQKLQDHVDGCLT